MSLFTINNYYYSTNEKVILEKLNTIMAEQKQFAEDLKTLQAQVAKIGDEILAKIAALEAALDAADDITPEVQAAFDALKAQVQFLDEMNPDA